MSCFSIAGLQLSLKNGNNLENILERISTVKSRFPWVDMIVLSELATFGADPNAALPTENNAIGQYCQIAKELDVWLVPGSLYESVGAEVFNTATVINNRGEVTASYRKMFPFAPYERGVSSGSDFVTFDIPQVGRFGISICYDKWFPETTRALAWLGAEVIIHPNLTNTIDRDVELSITRTNAATNQCYFFDINTAAPYGFGRSLVCGPGGEVIHQASAVEEMFVTDIDLDYLRRVRQRGWNGLGQTLKSFRDSEVAFPQSLTKKSPSLEALGKLEMPSQESK